MCIAVEDANDVKLVGDALDALLERDAHVGTAAGEPFWAGIQLAPSPSKRVICRSVTRQLSAPRIRV
jgi:hypothetical protein